MRFLSLSAVFVFAACAGGPLEGTVAGGTVADWRDVPTVVQLETRPSSPYSIYIWGVSSGSDFYVSSASWRSFLQIGDARWVAHIAEDPRVRLRVGDTLYERKAVRVGDAAELEAVVTLFETKYGDGPPVSRLREQLEEAAPADWDGVGIFRLDPR